LLRITKYKVSGTQNKVARKTNKFKLLLEDK